MVKTKKAKRLLIQLMAQLDKAFMSQDLDRMMEKEISDSYDAWSRRILCYENQLAPLKVKL